MFAVRHISQGLFGAVKRVGPGLVASFGVASAASSVASVVSVPVVPTAVAFGLAAAAAISSASSASSAGKLGGIAGIGGASLKPGAAFAATTLLRVGIVCVGLKLSLPETLQTLSLCVPVVLPTLAVTVASVFSLARLLRLDSQFAFLMSAGTGICGITAISAVAPVIQASEKFFTIAVANVVIFGMLGMLLQPLLAYWLFFANDETNDSKDKSDLGISPSTKAGLLLGVCIHDSSQVLGAAMSFRDAHNDEEAFTVATVTKLTRNSLLVVVVPLFALLHSRMNPQHLASSVVSSATKRPPLIPAFVAGFVGMAAVRSTVDYYLAQNKELASSYKQQWKRVITFVTDTVGTQFCLTMAMAGLGLNTQLSVLRGVGWKPFFVGGMGTIVATVTGYACIEALSAFRAGQMNKIM